MAAAGCGGFEDRGSGGLAAWREEVAPRRAEDGRATGILAWGLALAPGGRREVRDEHRRPQRRANPQSLGL